MPSSRSGDKGRMRGNGSNDSELRTLRGYASDKSPGHQWQQNRIEETGRQALVPQRRLSCMKAERKFNEAAGFTRKDDRLPRFFLEEKLLPSGNVFDVPEDEIDGVSAWPLLGDSSDRCRSSRGHWDRRLLRSEAYKFKMHGPRAIRNLGRHPEGVTHERPHV